jgi:LmbE family N-acetylglucosaminyl deacetylase
MRAPLRLMLAVVLVGGAAVRPALDAQVRPVYDLGAAGLTQVLERLQTTGSALHVGAHPDDEDSALIARTARGDNARVAYLSLTRGEGGQNIIGTELFEALGVIRTEELLQARTLDGGEQFFTRAIDYGFSKTREEAAAKWNEREILGDMVRVIRMFRPLVVTSRFSGTLADGHGQHQLAGHLTPLAFRAAARQDEFTQHFDEGLRPWQPKALYANGNDPEALDVQTGVFDPVLGRTYGEIAAEGRSQHKSQEMGTIERRGPSRSLLRSIERPGGGRPANDAIFAGLDTSITGIAALAGLPAGALQAELTAVADAARRALDQYEPRNPATIVPILAQGLRATRAARAAATSGAGAPDARAEADFLLSFKERDFSDALARASSVVVDALAEADTVVPGSSLGIAIRTFFPDSSAVRVVDAGLIAPDGWSVTPAGTTRQVVIPGPETPAHSSQFVVAVPVTAAVTQPYFLAEPRDGDRYRWPGPAQKTLPFASPPLEAWLTFEAGGVAATVRRPVEYRFADRIRGELRRNVHVVPAVTVNLDSRLLVVPLEGGFRQTGGTADRSSSPFTARIVVTARSFAGPPVSATVRLRLPAGWTSTPADADIMLGSRGDRTSSSFLVTPPSRREAGRVEIAAEALAGGVRYSSELQTIAYPHIQTHRIYRPATVTGQVVDLKVAPVRVGYVMGSGDQVPDAIRRLGVDVTLLSEETLMTGNLSSFDTIVVGVRASEARPNFAAEHTRLLQYVGAGGTLIVQYQQTDYVSDNLPPYPAFPPQGRGNSRVTDETAPVRILSPQHPVFTFPNRITADDFTGWVQERNLYAFSAFDSRYTALLESADSGEPAQQGGQVYAEVGRGRYVYTAYSWFRQLPAGVPGAYRQFANLISLSKAPRISGSRARGAGPQIAAAAPPGGGRNRRSR